jgi:hypothetical protein
MRKRGDLAIKKFASCPIGSGAFLWCSRRWPQRGVSSAVIDTVSPLPWRSHALVAAREDWTPLNFPPASVWRYTA